MLHRQQFSAPAQAGFGLTNTSGHFTPVIARIMSKDLIDIRSSADLGFDKELEAILAFVQGNS